MSTYTIGVDTEVIARVVNAVVSRNSSAALLFAFIALVVPRAIAAQSDPLVGTWTTDVVKSKSEPAGLRFRSWTSRIELVAGGYQVTGDGTTAQGQTIHSEVLWRFDGKESPTVGEQPPAAYTWKRIDDHSFETVRTDTNGTITSRTVISPDGKMRVNFHTAKNGQGKTLRNVLEVMYKR